MQNNILFTLYKNSKSDGLYVYRNNILYKYSIDGTWEENKDSIDIKNIQIKGFVLNEEQIKRLYIFYIKGYDYISFITADINEVVFLSDNYTGKDDKIITTNSNNELFPYTKIDGINQTVIIDLLTLLKINNLYNYIDITNMQTLKFIRNIYKKHRVYLYKNMYLKRSEDDEN